MTLLMSYILVLISVMLLVIILIVLKKSSINKENHVQVPLNYFTLQEPKYFFYDPDVAFEDEDADQTKLKDSYLFGENNYLRYYLNNTA